jgi:hypothetical protein
VGVGIGAGGGDVVVAAGLRLPPGAGAVLNRAAWPW